MKKRRTFQFVDTVAQAVALCNEINAGLPYYMRKHKPAYYTHWSNLSNTEHKLIVWYWY